MNICEKAGPLLLKKNKFSCLLGILAYIFSLNNINGMTITGLYSFLMENYEGKEICCLLSLHRSMKLILDLDLPPSLRDSFHILRLVRQEGYCYCSFQDTLVQECYHRAKRDQLCHSSRGS